MINEVIKSVDIFDDSVIFTTESGKQYKMYHCQDCCENVFLVDDYDNVLHSLVGKKIDDLSVDYREPSQEEIKKYYEYAESCTISEFKFKVNGATEIIRWFGNSNGYYGETATIEEIK